MKPMWKKYLNSLDAIENLMRVYLEMRRHFQEIGWSEKDLDSPPYFESKMYSYLDKFQNIRRAMLQDLHERGFDVPVEDFNSYLREFMTKINELTPLSNVGYKRDYSGDEDN